MPEKNYGIDTLRMLAMLMVAVLHILTHGGVLNASARFTSQYQAGWFLQSAAFCAVDVFGLISGYVWIYAKYRYRNMIELWLQVLFYTVSITALIQVLAPDSISAMDWIRAIFPVMFIQYWYFSSYAALFLFIPLLNVILEKTERSLLRRCLGMILLFYSCVQTLFYSDAFGTNDGYSAIWLMVLYLVGGYIRKYGSSRRGKVIPFLAGYFIIVSLTWLSKWIIEHLTLLLLGEVRAGNYLISYKSPAILLAAVCLLAFFEKMKISPFWERVIRFFSPMAFSVYLIHNHPLVVSILWKDRFIDYAKLPWVIEILAVLGTALAINLCCYGIDYLRLRLFRRLQIRRKLDYLENRLLKHIYSK